MMESQSSSSTPDPVQGARDALAAAQEVQRDVGQSMVYEPLDEALYAAAVAFLILAVGLGGASSVSTSSGLWVATALAYLAAAALLLLGVRRFRAKNGVWVSGYIAGRTRWITLVFVAVLLGLVIGAEQAGEQENWAAVAAATGAGAAFAFGLNRLWMRVYRAQTAAGPRG